ncbi:hypothetical protein THIOM_001799, partial [Candidatus Thiomargarita nelsonii]
MAETYALEPEVLTAEQEAVPSLLEGIMEETRLKPTEEGYAETVQGLEALIGELLKRPKGEKINKNVL